MYFPCVFYFLFQLKNGDVKGFRIGLLAEGFEGCEEDVAQLVKSVARKVTQLGATVEEFSSSLHKQGYLMLLYVNLC